MNKKTLGILSIPVMYLIFYLVVTKIRYFHFSYDLLFFATLGILFVSCHFFFDIKKMYEQIFKYRYIFGIGIFAILVIGGYHGSSVNFWNNYVSKEGNELSEKLQVSSNILGVSRGIRSDEWMVSTPYLLSQAANPTPFSKTNSLINAKDTDVSYYPRLPYKSYTALVYPSTIGFLFLPIEQAFSFYWYFYLFALFFVSIELFMIVTKKNKLYSVVGAFLITLAPAILWWNSCHILLFGEAALLVIYAFYQTSSVKRRSVLACILGWLAACYIMTMYPAWQLPYGYFFVILFVSLLIMNKEKLKWSDMLYLILTSIVCLILIGPLFWDARETLQIITNTAYPGHRVSYGGGNWKLLITYIPNTFYPYVSLGNPCEYSQFLSFFPIPILLSVYYIFKNYKEKKTDWYLILVTGFILVLTLWCIFPLPAILSKLTLMTMTIPDRAQLVIGYASIFLMIYLLANYEKEEKIQRNTFIFYAILALVISCVLSYVSINLLGQEVFGKKISVLCVILFVPMFTCLFMNTKKGNFALSLFLLGTTFVSSLLICPLTRGLDVFYESSFAHQIQAMVEEDSKAKYLVVDGDFSLPNYMITNGARVINSTNYVPNLELWKKLDEEKKHEEIYNRYSHVSVTLTSDLTSFELNGPDHFTLHLNYNDICKTGTNYLVAHQEINTEEISLTDIYQENNIYIYKTSCLESSD